MGGIARHKDQVQLGVPQDLVGELVPVGAAGEADGWAKAHPWSLRWRPGTLYRSDTTPPLKSRPRPRSVLAPTSTAVGPGAFDPRPGERSSSSAPRPGGAGRSVCQSKLA